MSVKRSVPELRFRGFSGKWEVKKFGECVLIQRGGSPRPIENFITNDENGINWIKIGDVSTASRYITKTKQKIIREGEKHSRNVYKGDLILSNSMSFGRPYIMEIDGCIHDGWLLIRDEKKMFNLEYLLQLLSSDYMINQYKALAAGGVVINLNSELVQSTNVFIPDIKEQTKIGNYFQNLDKLIEQKEKKHQKLGQLKKAMLEKMFPKEGATTPEIRFKGFSGEWEEKKIGDIGSIGMNKRVFKNQTSEKGDIPFFKIGTFGDKANAFISRNLFEEYKSKYPYPKKGDLLISASGSIGKIVEYTGKDEYYQDSNIVWLIHNNQIENLFLKQFYKIVKWHGLEGSTIQRLYNKNILETNIILPSKNEQKKIGNYFQKLDHLIDLQNQELQKLKNIKKASLAKMFV